MNNQLDITPNASKTIESLRYLTYTNATALADIVDNSLDANAENITITIDKEKYIIIQDDGFGMTFETMCEAIKLGSNTEKESTDLGRFGMGLVTASISMGRKLEVVSKITGQKAHKVCLDLDKIMETNKWCAEEESLTMDDEVRMNSLESGTVVTISKLDSIERNIASNADAHFRQVFRGFLFSGRTISLNGRQITPLDPLERDRSETQALLEDDIDVDGEKVHVALVHLDPNKSELAAKNDDKNHLTYNPTNEGYYIVRNNREIAAAQTLGLYTRHPEFNRFRCEISYSSNLDKQFGINFTKNHIEMTKSLSDKIDNITKQYRNMIRSQAKKASEVEASQQISHSDAEEIISRKKALLKTKTGWLEKRERSQAPRKPKDTTESEKNISRDNIKKIQPGNKAMPAEIMEADLGTMGPLYDCSFEGNKIIIRWNIRHPFHSQLIAKYSTDKDVTTPVDLLIYSLAQAELSFDEDSDQKNVFQRSMSNVANNLRVLLQ